MKVNYSKAQTSWSYPLANADKAKNVAAMADSSPTKAAPRNLAGAAPNRSAPMDSNVYSREAAGATAQASAKKAASAKPNGGVAQNRFDIMV